MADADLKVDGHRVKMFEDGGRNCFYDVPVDDVISHHYERYLPILNEHFSDFDFAGLVTWHKGKNAADCIPTVHTTGDVVSGYFGAAAPSLTRSLMLAVEQNRVSAGLDGFTTVSEATHWSGIVYGSNPELILRFPVLSSI